MGKIRSLFKKTGDIKGTFHPSMGTIKDRNSKDLTEAEDIKRWQEYIQELYKKGFLNEQCKEIEDNNRKNKTRDHSRKLEISREYFMQGWA